MLQQKFQESLVNKIIDGTQEKNRGFLQQFTNKSINYFKKILRNSC